MERRTHGGRQAGAEAAAAGVGYPFLAGPRTMPAARALFDFAIDSKLRGCGVVKILIGDLVCGGPSGRGQVSCSSRRVDLSNSNCLEAPRTSIRAWLEQCSGTLDDYASRAGTSAGSISAPGNGPLVDERAGGVGLRREDCGTHSLRRTKVSIICKATGNLRAVQILLGHTKTESTVRCLGVMSRMCSRSPSIPRCRNWTGYNPFGSEAGLRTILGDQCRARAL
jgi:hypothetical protein